MIDRVEAVLSSSPEHVLLEQARDPNGLRLLLRTGRFGLILLELTGSRPWEDVSSLSQEFPDIPIVAILSRSKPRIIQACKSAGASACLSKNEMSWSALSPLLQRAAASDREAILREGTLAALGAVSAGVAHEMNHRITYIQSSLDLVLEGIEESRVLEEQPRLAPLYELIKKARENAGALREMVLNIKNAGRINAEESRPTLVSQSIESALSLAAPHLLQAARIETNVDSTLVALACPSWITQILLNLLLNAAQAMPKGREREENLIRVIGTRTPGGQVLIEVSDNGVGIANEAVPKIFEPFFSTKEITADQGSGLGLSVCKSLAERMNADIRVQSQPGFGSTFSLILSSAENLSEKPLPNCPDGARVLIIEDDPELGSIMKDVLEANFRCLVCTRGQEALELIQKDEHFDVIISDLMMPDMTGAELYQKITHSHPGLEKKFVFITGGAYTPGTREFLKTVSNVVVEKPFSLNHVRALVRALLS